MWPPFSMSDVSLRPSRSGTSVVRSPMQELPLDVCLEIITATLRDLDFDDYPKFLQILVALSHISSNFRQAALQSATLWAEALKVNHPHPTAFDTVLSRTRAAPFGLTRITMDVKNVLVAKRTKQLLDNEVGRLTYLTTDFQPDVDLESFWTALEKPTPLLRYLFLSTQVKSAEQELRHLWPRKKLFEDATSNQCVLSLLSCTIPDTLVATHKLVSLELIFHKWTGRLTTRELCRWWSVCLDGTSMPSLKSLCMNTFFDIKADLQSLSLVSTNPTPRLPPNLAALTLVADLDSLVILLGKVQVPSACSPTQWTFSVILDEHDDENLLIETATAIFSRFWKSRVTSPCQTFQLRIGSNNLRIRHKSVDDGTFEISVAWGSATLHHRLVKEILHQMASEEHFPNLSVFAPKSYLHLEPTCGPELASYLYEAYIELLKRFSDSVKNLNLNNIHLSPDAMNVLRLPRAFSKSAGGEPLLFPNVHRVIFWELDSKWQTSEPLVNALNRFAAGRDRCGAPIVFMTPGPIKKVMQMPLMVRYEKEAEEQGDAGDEQGEGSEDEEGGKEYTDDERGEENENEGEETENEEEGEEYTDDEEFEEEEETKRNRKSIMLVV